MLTPVSISVSLCCERVDIRRMDLNTFLYLSHSHLTIIHESRNNATVSLDS